MKPGYTVVGVPDLHFPCHDSAAVECCRRIIKAVSPHETIYFGDIGEWSSVSEWQYKRKRRPHFEDLELIIQQEIADINRFLDTFPYTRHVTVLQGNHDLWLDNFYESYPYSGSKQYRFRNAIRLDDRAWGYHPYGKLYTIGKLNMYHGGHYSNTYHCRKHLMQYGVNIMYAHMHSKQYDTIAHVDGYKAAWCIGCLKRIDNAANRWLQNRKVNWGHCVAVIDFTYSGRFRADIIDITAGVTTFHGKVINGNKAR